MRTEWLDCWVYPGSKPRGYGQATYDGRKCETHRAAYEAIKGAVPAGLHLDHLCRNPACYNPDHLEPVTPAENVRRGNSPTTVIRRTGVCPQGHSDWMERPNGSLRCHPCHIEQERLAVLRHQATRRHQRVGRTCQVCHGPIPLDRNAKAIYCSSTCKDRRHNSARRPALETT